MCPQENAGDRKPQLRAHKKMTDIFQTLWGQMTLLPHSTQAFLDEKAIEESDRRMDGFVVLVPQVLAVAMLYVDALVGCVSLLAAKTSTML